MLGGCAEIPLRHAFVQIALKYGFINQVLAVGHRTSACPADGLWNLSLRLQPDSFGTATPVIRKENVQSAQRGGLGLQEIQKKENSSMNSDEMRGKWNQLKGSVKQQWAKLTDDDLTAIDGNRDKLVGKIQERYGIAKEKAEQQLNEWRMPTSTSTTTTREEEVKTRKVS
jgi:uncharacterized protein YjbJ (UPF0337 family)